MRVQQQTVDRTRTNTDDGIAVAQQDDGIETHFV